MAQGKRNRLSAEQRADMWRRWKAGESLHEIGRAFGKGHGSIRFLVSVKQKRQNHIDSYRLLAAHAVGVSSGSLWMDKLASPGRTAARYSRTGILSRRQVSTMERITATRGPAFS
jgi:hypothetical protein